MIITNRIFISVQNIIKSLGVLFIVVNFTSERVFAEDTTCFNEIVIEPSFVAFTTTKESKLADWYQTTFGLNVVKEFSFPDGTVNGVLMHKREFIVEVFNRDDALVGSDYVEKAKPEEWRGVMKYGIYTNANLSLLKQCLINQGIKAGRIFKDEKLGIDLLQVIDPEQNVLEIISRFE